MAAPSQVWRVREQPWTHVLRSMRASVDPSFSVAGQMPLGVCRPSTTLLAEQRFLSSPRNAALPTLRVVKSPRRSGSTSDHTSVCELELRAPGDYAYQPPQVEEVEGLLHTVNLGRYDRTYLCESLGEHRSYGQADLPVHSLARAERAARLHIFYEEHQASPWMAAALNSFWSVVAEASYDQGHLTPPSPRVGPARFYQLQVVTATDTTMVTPIAAQEYRRMANLFSKGHSVVLKLTADAIELLRNRNPQNRHFARFLKLADQPTAAWLEKPQHPEHCRHAMIRGCPDSCHPNDMYADRRLQVVYFAQPKRSSACASVVYSWCRLRYPALFPADPLSAVENALDSSLLRLRPGFPAETSALIMSYYSFTLEALFHPAAAILCWSTTATPWFHDEFTAPEVRPRAIMGIGSDDMPMGDAMVSTLWERPGEADVDRPVIVVTAGWLPVEQRSFYHCGVLQPALANPQAHWRAEDVTQLAAPCYHHGLIVGGPKKPRYSRPEAEGLCDLAASLLGTCPREYGASDEHYLAPAEQAAADRDCELLYEAATLPGCALPIRTTESPVPAEQPLVSPEVEQAARARATAIVEERLVSGRALTGDKALLKKYATREKASQPRSKHAPTGRTERLQRLWVRREEESATSSAGSTASSVRVHRAPTEVRKDALVIREAPPQTTATGCAETVRERRARTHKEARVPPLDIRMGEWPALPDTATRPTTDASSSPPPGAFSAPAQPAAAGDALRTPSPPRGVVSSDMVRIPGPYAAVRRQFPLQEVAPTAAPRPARLVSAGGGPGPATMRWVARAAPVEPAPAPVVREPNTRAPTAGAAACLVAAALIASQRPAVPAPQPRAVAVDSAPGYCGSTAPPLSMFCHQRLRTVMRLTGNVVMWRHRVMLETHAAAQARLVADEHTARAARQSSALSELSQLCGSWVERARRLVLKAKALYWRQARRLPAASAWSVNDHTWGPRGSLNHEAVNETVLRLAGTMQRSFNFSWQDRPGERCAQSAFRCAFPMDALPFPPDAAPNMPDMVRAVGHRAGVSYVQGTGGNATIVPYHVPIDSAAPIFLLYDYPMCHADPLAHWAVLLMRGSEREPQAAYVGPVPPVVAPRCIRCAKCDQDCCHFTWYRCTDVVTWNAARTHPGWRQPDCTCIESGPCQHIASRFPPGSEMHVFGRFGQQATDVHFVRSAFTLQNPAERRLARYLWLCTEAGTFSVRRAALAPKAFGPYVVVTLDPAAHLRILGRFPSADVFNADGKTARGMLVQPVKGGPSYHELWPSTEDLEGCEGAAAITTSSSALAAMVAWLGFGARHPAGAVEHVITRVKNIFGTQLWRTMAERVTAPNGHMTVYSRHSVRNAYIQPAWNLSLASQPIPQTAYYSGDQEAGLAAQVLNAEVLNLLQTPCTRLGPDEPEVNALPLVIQHAVALFDAGLKNPSDAHQAARDAVGVQSLPNHVYMAYAHAAVQAFKVTRSACSRVIVPGGPLPILATEVRRAAGKWTAELPELQDAVHDDSPDASQFDSAMTTRLVSRPVRAIAGRNIQRLLRGSVEVWAELFEEPLTLASVRAALLDVAPEAELPDPDEVMRARAWRQAGWNPEQLGKLLEMGVREDNFHLMTAPDLAHLPAALQAVLRRVRRQAVAPKLAVTRFERALMALELTEPDSAELHALGRSNWQHLDLAQLLNLKLTDSAMHGVLSAARRHGCGSQCRCVGNMHTNALVEYCIQAGEWRAARNLARLEPADDPVSGLSSVVDATEGATRTTRMAVLALAAREFPIVCECEEEHDGVCPTACALCAQHHARDTCPYAMQITGGRTAEKPTALAGPVRPKGGAPSTGAECYNCGVEGHTSKNCPREAQEHRPKPLRECHVCKSTEHLARHCLVNPAAKATGKGKRKRRTGPDERTRGHAAGAIQSRVTAGGVLAHYGRSHGAIEHAGEPGLWGACTGKRPTHISCVGCNAVAERASVTWPKHLCPACTALARASRKPQTRTGVLTEAGHTLDILHAMAYDGHAMPLDHSRAAAALVSVPITANPKVKDLDPAARISLDRKRAVAWDIAYHETSGRANLARLCALGVEEICTTFKADSLNTTIAVVTRVLADKPQKETPGFWPAAWAFTLRLSRCGYQPFPRGVLRRMDDEAWLQPFPPARRAELRRAREADEQGAYSLAKLSRFDILLKQELAANGSPAHARVKAGELQAPLRRPKANPRAIQSPHLACHTRLGPWMRPATHELHRMYHPGHGVVYCGGLTPRQLDEWVRRAAVPMGRLALQMDISAMDASYQAGAFSYLENMVLLMGFPTEHLALYRAIARPRGRSRTGLRYQATTCNASGRVDTSFNNAAINAVLLQISVVCAVHRCAWTDVAGLSDQQVIDALTSADVAIMGDDSIAMLPAEVARRCTNPGSEVNRVFAAGGFKTVAAVTELEAAVFLGCRPWITTHGLKWGPTLGRRLYKLFWQRIPDARPMLRVYQVADATRRAYGFVPVLRDFCDTALRFVGHHSRYGRAAEPTMDMSAIDLARARSPWESDASMTAETVDQLCRIYGLHRGQYEALQLELARVPALPWVVRSEVTRRCLEVDDL